MKLVTLLILGCSNTKESKSSISNNTVQPKETIRIAKYLENKGYIHEAYRNI